MLEKAYKEGKLRAIGVSNFPVEKLEELLQSCEIYREIYESQTKGGNDHE